MKIGIVAADFPPAVGGMENHAAGLAAALAIHYDITIFTKKEYAGLDYDYPYAVKPMLVRRVEHDKRQLKHERVDAWLTLDAAYSCLAGYVEQPVFAYCHGNDFLNASLRGLNMPEAIFVYMVGTLPFFWRFKEPIARWLYRRRLRVGLGRAKLVFANSRNTRDVLLKTFPTLVTTVEVSYPGASDLFFLKPKQPDHYTGEPIRILTVARLASFARRKNVDGVLRALALIKGDIPFLYTIVGEGNIRKELETLASELGIAEQTEFTGSISNEQLVACLDESDLFVLPSKANGLDVEGFGIVYAEAAARGVPSLISRAGGATDAVFDGVSGVVIDGAEPDDIAVGIRRFKGTREQFDSAAIRDFANRFRWPNIAARMSAEIERLTQQ